jgi:hypothetical protein
VYDDRKPYCLFNVMMIAWDARDVVSRVAIGKVHIDAFMGAGITDKVINLE